AYEFLRMILTRATEYNGLRRRRGSASDSDFVSRVAGQRAKPRSGSGDSPRQLECLDAALSRLFGVALAPTATTALRCRRPWWLGCSAAMARMREVHRCTWAVSDPLMQGYHDEEWGVPEHDGRALWVSRQRRPPPLSDERWRFSAAAL